jgi:hypothetical protein
MPTIKEDFILSLKSFILKNQSIGHLYTNCNANPNSKYKLDEILDDIFYVLKTGNADMFHYSCEHYNYVPSVPIIMLCPDKPLAFTALYKFYPELTKGFNFVEEPDNIKQSLAKYPKESIIEYDDILPDAPTKLLSEIDEYELSSKCKSVKTEPIFNDNDNNNKESKPVKKNTTKKHK